jgi:hypothetical protein
LDLAELNGSRPSTDPFEVEYTDDWQIEWEQE